MVALRIAPLFTMSFWAMPLKKISLKYLRKDLRWGSLKRSIIRRLIAFAVSFWIIAAADVKPGIKRCSMNTARNPFIALAPGKGEDLIAWTAACLIGSKY